MQSDDVKNPPSSDPQAIPLSKLISDKPLSGMVSIDTTGENFEIVGEKSPEIVGEESVSGSEPDPESDDDLLANAQAVGEQLGEDPEHPEEIDIARDIDAAEKAHQED